MGAERFSKMQLINFQDASNHKRMVTDLTLKKCIILNCYDFFKLNDYHKQASMSKTPNMKSSNNAE